MAPENVRGPYRFERVTGIEPALSAWEADVLPLNYTRSCTDRSRSMRFIMPDLPWPVEGGRTRFKPRRGDCVMIGTC